MQPTFRPTPIRPPMSPTLYLPAIFAGVAIIAAILTYLLPVPFLSYGPGTYGIEIIIAVFNLWSFILQLRYLKPIHPRLYLMEIVLLVGFSLLPAFGVAFGDMDGAAHFGTKVDAPFFEDIAIIAPYFFAGIVICFSIGNALFIRFQASRSMRILGWFFYVLLWIISLGLSYIGYSIAYSLHDPATE